MTLAWSSVGDVVQKQFGVNEIASSLVVGRWVGSVVSRSADADSIQLVASKFGLHVRDVPRYLETVSFSRSGTILAGGQQRYNVNNTLSDVTLRSVSGIATFMVLVLRHVESTVDIVDYLQDLMRGKFSIVGRATSEELGEGGLPHSLRQILHTFVNGVIDADADSSQLNKTRMMMSQLVSLVGNSKFLNSVTKPAQQEQARFLFHLFQSPSQSAASKEHHLSFHTLSAGAAMIALAASANGANVHVRCMLDGTRPVTLPMPEENPRRLKGALQVNLWLVEPPREIADHLHSLQSGGTFQARTEFQGMLPILGGTSELSLLVAQQLGCKNRPEEVLEFWQEGLKIGASCSWSSRVESRPPVSGLVCQIDSNSLFRDKEIPSTLSSRASEHFRAPRGDVRHELAKKAGSAFHKVLAASTYDDYPEDRLHTALDLIILAMFTGCIGKLATAFSNKLTSYAWTAECKQFLGFAEAAVSHGLTINRIVMAAARIWGGMPPSFVPTWPSEGKVLGIVCPQTTILINVLSHPEDLAVHGLEKGLFTLHQGSVPTIPRDRSSGLVFAGSKAFRRAVQNLDAREQIPAEAPDERPLIFTVEPATSEDGVLASCLCAWMHGDVALELNPYQVLCGLLGKRELSGTYMSPPMRRPLCLAHIGHQELTSLTDGFCIYHGVALVRTGSRTDLQIAAAGIHAGPRTVMIRTDEDANYLRQAQAIHDAESRICTIDPKQIDEDLADGTVMIFCRDDLPPHFGSVIPEPLEELN